MRKNILFIIALVFPVHAIGGTAVVTGFSNHTNMVTAFDSDMASSQTSAADSMLYTHPGTSNVDNPFDLAAADYEDSNPWLVSADKNFMLAAADGNADEDLPFMDDDDELLDVYDPLETFNRGMFWVNDKLYFYLMKPIAKGYRFVTPEVVRVSVGNFFTNLKFPMRMINAGLQGKFSGAGTEIGRFGINTTIGILGFFDPASSYFEIKATKEDTGQTMGYYGLGPGPYLVIPFIGPSSFRDGLGFVADSQMDILTYVLEHRDYWGAVVFRGINTLALDKDTYEGIKQDALDPYLFVRDAWTQYRQNLVEN